jgi:hypothetical protein
MRVLYIDFAIWQRAIAWVEQAREKKNGPEIAF